MTKNTNNHQLLVANEIKLCIADKQILNHVSLQINQQEIITLIGPNGAGKTSLLRILLGLNRPSSGTVQLKPNLRIGYMPQRIHIPAVMPLRVCDFLGTNAKANLSEQKDALNEVHCSHLYTAAMQQLSGGEMQRILLARALLKKPQLLILDEPASGMDMVGQQTLYQIIKKIRDKYHCGILMVSHDLHLVMAATDRVICLNTHICCTGHPDKISEHPEYIKMFGQAIDGLAHYPHHHDHEHDIHGDIIKSERCSFCEHHPSQQSQDKNNG